MLHVEMFTNNNLNEWNMYTSSLMSSLLSSAAALASAFQHSVDDKLQAKSRFFLTYDLGILVEIKYPKNPSYAG